MIELDDIEYLPNSVQRILAEELSNAATRINNEGIRLPEREWRMLREFCSSIEKSAKMARLLAQHRSPASIFV